MILKHKIKDMKMNITERQKNLKAIQELLIQNNPTKNVHLHCQSYAENKENGNEIFILSVSLTSKE